MPLYTDPATGRKIRSEHPLTDAELEEAFGAATTTTPTTTGDVAPRLLRAAPAVAGAIRGGATGAELGAPLGPLGMVLGGGTGAALGAMGGETALGLGQQALGLPQGRAPMLPRVAQAGREGFTAGVTSEILGPTLQKGLEAASQYGSKLASRLGLTKPFGIDIGAGEQKAAGMAGTRGAAGVVAKAATRQGSQIARAGQQVLDEIGDTEQTTMAIRRGTRAMRNVLRGLLTRGEKPTGADLEAAGPLKDLLPTRIGKLGRGIAHAPGQTSAKIEQIIEDTVNEASVAERLAAHPGAMDALLQRQGRPVVDELRRGWWTRTLTEATGTKGLQKGVINPQTIVSAFDGLGPKAAQLFGDQLPTITKFVDTLRGLPLGGAVPEKVAPIPWSVLMGGIAAIVGHGTGTRAIQAAAGAGGALAAPFLAAKLLTSPHGAEILTHVLSSSVLSTAARVAPTVIRAGAQAVTQTQPPPPPAVPEHVQVPP